MRGLPLGAGQWRHGPRGQGWVSGRGCPLGGPGQKSQAGSRGQLAGSQTWRWQSHLDPSLGLPCPKQQAPSRCHMWELKGHTPSPPARPVPIRGRDSGDSGSSYQRHGSSPFGQQPPPPPASHIRVTESFGRSPSFAVHSNTGSFLLPLCPRPPRGSTAQRPHRPAGAPLTSLMLPPPSSSP